VVPFFQVALSYQRGEYAAAYPLLLRYAEEGNPEACLIIATYHHLGLGGIAIDETVVVKLYTYASAEGFAVASNNLGTIALMSDDREGARKWYDKAQEQRFPHSPRLSKVHRPKRGST
jgi:TPR repeat protein